LRQRRVSGEKAKTKMESYKLYGGKIQLDYDPKFHIYSVGGIRVYGVTNITGILNKPGLLYWGVNKAVEFLGANWQPGKVYDEVQIKNLLEEARKAHTQIKNEAADIGSMIHQWVSDYVKAISEKKTPPKRPINKEMKAAIDGFFKWAKKSQLKIMRSEQKLYHDKWGYAGTLDLEGIVEGKRTVIDLKTGNRLYPEAFLQAAAYLKAREQETGKKYPGGVIIVRLSKKVEEAGKVIIEPFEVKKDEEVELHFKAFLNCLQIYKWQMAMRKREQLNKLNSIH